MSNDQLSEIRRRLDEELSVEKFKDDPRPTEEAATQFFQDLFVQMLNFDMSISATGQDTWSDLPAYEWRESARANAARLFAEAGNFRVIYVELDNLTRTAERNAIQSLTRSDRRGGWAIEGSFLTVFHAPEEETWHLVTPYEEDTDDVTTGRPVLRRYTRKQAMNPAMSTKDANSDSEFQSKVT